MKKMEAMQAEHKKQVAQLKVKEEENAKKLEG